MAISKVNTLQKASSNFDAPQPLLVSTSSQKLEHYIPHAGAKDLPIREPRTIAQIDASQCLIDLVKKFATTWDPDKGLYTADFSVPEFVRILNCYNATFPPTYDPATEFGIIEKTDLPPNSKIFVRADLHADLHSVIETLNALQEDGYIDEEYRCSPNTYLVFLGDFADRGYHNIETIATLQLLKMINKDHVLLVRGNHETVWKNANFNKKVKGSEREDRKFSEILETPEYRAALDQFYNSGSLSGYCAEESEGKRHYVQFSHTAVEITCDPAPLLDSPASHDTMKVSKTFEFSKRISELLTLAKDPAATMDPKKRAAVLTIAELASQESTKEFRQSKKVKDIFGNFILKSAYSWPWIHRGSDLPIVTDVDKGEGWQLPSKAIRAYQILSSDKHDVDMLIRGHDHLFSDCITEDGHIFIKTLPVGVDSPVSIKRGPVRDTWWVLTTGATIDKWQRDVYTRIAKTPTVERHFSHRLHHPQLSDVEENKSVAEDSY